MTRASVRQAYAVETHDGRGRYIVTGPDGRRVGPVHASHSAAVAARDALQRRHDRQRGAQRRPCLCCGRPFDSEGIHNRLCNECRRESTASDMSHGPSVRSAARAGHR